MASKAHQFMITLTSRKMREKGYEPIMYDGDSYDIGLHKLKIPTKVINHRPDVIGINVNEDLCIGEVKTPNDLSSKRTKNQLLDFSRNHEMIICTPMSCKENMLRKLTKLNVILKKNVDYIFVPDELIPNDDE